MLKHVLFSSLLAVLSGCMDEKIIGPFQDAGTDGGGSDSDGVIDKSEFDMLVAAAQSLSGNWSSPTLLQVLGIGPSHIDMKLTPIAGTKRGTFRASCPDRCDLLRDPKDGGMPPVELDRGEYELLRLTATGQVHGVFFSDDYAFGLTFDPESNPTSRPNHMLIQVPLGAVPLDREPSQDPGP